MFLLLGDGFEVECKPVTFLETDRNQLLNDLATHSNTMKSCIIECTYDPWIGYWRYQGIRSKLIHLLKTCEKSQCFDFYVVIVNMQLTKTNQTHYVLFLIQWKVFLKISPKKS